MSDFALSRDGRRLAYVTSRMDVLRRRYRVVVDGTGGPEFDEVPILRFSRDGRRVGYVGVSDGKHSVVVDGATAGSHAEVQALVLGSAGGAVAYSANEGEKSFVVLNGQRTRTYDAVTDVSISPDGRTVAYGACAEQKCFVVAGQQHGPEYAWISMIGLSRDGQRVGYWASRDRGSGFVVIGDRVGEPVRNPSVWSAPQFSPDGQRYWYVTGVQNKGSFVVSDGVRGPSFAEVGAAAFSPDGSQLAYPAQTRDGKWLLVLGDQRSPAADFVGSVTFGRDGRTVGYGARIGGELWWKVMDVGTPATSGAAAQPAAVASFNEQTVRTRLVRDFEGNVYGVAAAGGLVAAKSLGTEMGVFLVDAITGESRGQFPDGLPIALSPDGRLLAIGSKNGLSVWNTAEGMRVSALTADAGGGVAFAGGNEQLITWNADGEPTWWNVTTAARAQAMKSVERPDPKQLVSPDGRLGVRISDYDQAAGRSSLTFIDRGTGSTLGVVPAPEGIVAAAAFGADGSSIVLGGLDGRVHIITFPPFSG